MRMQADSDGITSIAIPRIGVGYGGLSWKKVRATVEAVFGDWSGILVVYEEYVAGESAATFASLERPRAARTPSSVAVSAADRSQTVRSIPSRTATTEAPDGDAVSDVIRFYRVRAQYGCFSNFSPHQVRLKDKTWPTSEHYFQAQKFAGTPDEEEIHKAKSATIAARMGRSRKRPLRRDWESVKDSIMHEAVVAKFNQHADLRETLLATGDSTIVEHTTNDAYWGDGGNGSGKNRLGEILMRVRELLRQSEPN
jgi:ribA/ribD-fused uncharacterized protein